MFTVEQILGFIGRVVAYGGGSAAVAYLLFQTLGRSWLENRFASQLEALRHQQALELQRLRVEIDALLSGALKLQEQEFSVLPEAWEKLDETHGLVAWLVSPMQQYADVDRMTGPQLEEFLGTTSFLETQKQDIRVSRSKGKTYQDILFWHRLAKVKASHGDLQRYIARKGIFLPADIKSDLSSIADKLWEALISKEVGHEAKDWKMQREGWTKIKNEIEPLYKKIEATIQARLASHGRRA